LQWAVFAGIPPLPTYPTKRTPARTAAPPVFGSTRR
jgi:hypothetical protein